MLPIPALVILSIGMLVVITYTHFGLTNIDQKRLTEGEIIDRDWETLSIVIPTICGTSETSVP